MEKEMMIELVHRAQVGDENAFEDLYRELYPMVYSIAYKISQSDADAKDITQATFIQARHSLPHLKDPVYFRLWLQKITMSKSKNLFRKNKISTCDIDEHQVEANVSLHHNPYDPVSNAHFHNDQEILYSLLEQLSKPQAIVIYKMYFEQKTLEEIAKELKVPLGTVKSRAHIAKKQLLQLIQKYEERNQCKLDFHSSILEGAVGGSFFHTLGNACKGGMSTAQLTGMQALLVMCSTLLVATASLGAYKALTSSSKPSTVDSLRLSYSVKKPSFPIVHIDGKSYENAADAYYRLKSFAHCNVELEQMSQEEKNTVLPLYEELKKFQGAYWNLLVDSGWAEEYEKNKIK